MGINRGPGVVNDGLVFGYDTGYPISDNTTNNRFNQGQPATNLFTVLGSPSNVDENVTFSVNGTGTFKRVAVGTEIGDYKVNDVDVVYSYVLGVNGCHYHGNDYSSVPSGTKVSLSVEYFLSPDVGSFDTNYLGNFEQLSGISGSWGTVSSTKGVWHKVTLTRTATATGNLRMLMYPGACGNTRLSATGTIYYKNPTVTLTEQPVPFVDGTRSDTASLIDLKRTVNIDVSGVSFNSNAQPTFDGTNDVINLPNDLGYSANSVSVFAWYKINGSPGNSYHIICGDTCLEISIHSSATYIRNGVSTTNGRHVSNDGNQTLNDGNYHYYGFTFDGSTKRAYIDGVQVGTQSVTGTLTTSFGGRKVGAFSGGYYANGDLPVYKVYDKVLTAEEVLKNYNAYKNRFNL